MLDCRVLKIPTVSKASNSCCSYSRCSSTEMSWRTTTRSLMPISCPLNLMEKVPSTMARPQQPSCSTKCPASLCANQVESRYILQNPHRLSRLKAHCSGVGGRKKSNEWSVWELQVMLFSVLLLKHNITGTRQPHPKSQSNLQYCVSSLVDTPYCIHVLDCFSDWLIVSQATLTSIHTNLVWKSAILVLRLDWNWKFLMMNISAPLFCNFHTFNQLWAEAVLTLVFMEALILKFWQFAGEQQNFYYTKLPNVQYHFCLICLLFRWFRNRRC